MPERDSRKYGYDNIRVNSQIINLAVFRLLSIFLADKEIQKLYTKGHFSSCWSILDEIKEEQITHHLIEIATLYRTEENHWVIPRDIKKREQEKLVVGKFYEPIGVSPKPLTMIEACNKIIHAETINYDERRLPKSYLSYLHPEVYLYGKKYRTKWKAVLDITKFCEKALRM